MKIEIIPAIDIIEGKCVRLSKGDYEEKTVYSEDPAEMAKHFADLGLKKLHLVDLDGARAAKVVNLSVLEKISATVNLQIDFGGGLRSDNDLRAVFSAGADKVTVGSIAVHDPGQVEKWLDEFGPDKIILGADARDEKIAIHGWQEESQVDLMPFIAAYKNKGIREIICTDVSRDGMLSGPSVQLYRKLLNEFSNLRIIASGGVSCMADIIELQQITVPAVIVGKAYYEGRINDREIENHVM